MLMQNKVYQVFTHKDLDGAVSLLTLMWSRPQATITYKEVSNLETHFINDYVEKTINPPQIVILDLFLRESFLPHLDKKEIIFIDHHLNSEEFISKFKNSKLVIKPFSSNSLLTRKFLQESAPEFTENQKKLILLADDFDSGNMNFSESYDLNILFWTEYKNDFSRFVNSFKDGFKPFSQNQIERINKAKEQAKEIAKKTKCFSGEVLIEGEIKKVFAAINDVFNSIAIDTLVSKYKPDIFLFVNTNTQKISLRQSKSKNLINLSKFAEKYCDGAGHTYVAGGKITPMFMELTKKLNPI